VGLPGYGTLGSTGTQHAVSNWTHIFSPQFIAEVRAGYSRLKVLNLQEDYNVDVVSKLGILGLTDVGKTPFNNGAPRVSLTGYAGIGGGTSQPQGRGENTYHYVATMTYIRGTHTFKMGGDYFRFLFNSFNTSTGRGSFNFDGRYTGNSVADLLLGFPFQASRALGEPFHNAVLTSSGAYFQDDWKLNARLTLNLGIRYELYPALTERVNKLSSFDPSTNTLIVAGDREAFLSPTGAVPIRAPGGDSGEKRGTPRAALVWRAPLPRAGRSWPAAERSRVRVSCAPRRASPCTTGTSCPLASCGRDRRRCTSRRRGRNRRDRRSQRTSRARASHTLRRIGGAR